MKKGTKSLTVICGLVLLCAYGYSHRPRFVAFRERLFHKCLKEWRGPFGPLDEWDYVCTEDGKKLGQITHFSEGWDVFDQCGLVSDIETLDTLDRAKAVVEKSCK